MNQHMNKEQKKEYRKRQKIREAIMLEMSLYFSRNPDAKKEINERALARVKREKDA